MSDKTLNITPADLKAEFSRILNGLSVESHKAEVLAQIFTDNTADGIFSHGILRFPRFVDYIKKGYIDIHAESEVMARLGALEQWNGKLGVGPLNALAAVKRAMKLADEYGLGCIALANTNHWMRGGTYGRVAVNAGYAYLGWTNTEPNMPAWGANDSRLGNNPLVLGLPYQNHGIVLDMAMTQFAYGKLEEYKLRGERCPVPGGFDTKGHITDDPVLILESMKGLPIGYWKGAGLSLLLDLLGSTLAGGDSTCQLQQKEAEYGLCQIFLVFNLHKLPNADGIQQQLEQTIAFYKQSVPSAPNIEILYPGERTKKRRDQHQQTGVPIPQSVWEQLCKLS